MWWTFFKPHILPVQVGVAIMTAFLLGYCQREHEVTASQIEREQLLEQKEADLKAREDFLHYETQTSNQKNLEQILEFSTSLLRTSGF